ncbi:MAG: homoserine dehydrogenase [Bacteroidota bacterium]|jgi:homoserine dehydrogenase|nr:homoserine dehydrogenase [Bacteroidota bacterium]
MEKKDITIGLFGFGCVGQGLYDVLNHSQGLRANIERICVKDKNKPRSIAAGFFTYDKEDILTHKDLNVIVELIDNADEAFAIVKQAMNNGVSVVTANKKMLAENFRELYDLQIKNSVALIYEGSAGGSIPIIRNLEEYYDNELLSSVRGILNGTCNYILTRMELENKDYSDVLKDAQVNGFAESDPWLDVAGFDTKFKTLLLTIHAFGIVLNPEDIFNTGIQNITYDDILYAKQRGLRIKMLAVSYKVGDKFRVYAIPHFVDKSSELFNVNYEYNAVEVEGAYSCKQTFVGKGAGSHPTGSAVLSDISALTYDYKYGYKKLKKQIGISGKIEEGKSLIEYDFPIKLYIRYQDREQLNELEIISVEEEYKSSGTNYIIATVNFKSLFNIYDKRGNKLFICAI